MTTSTQTQLRRGTSSQIAAMTPAEGEVVMNKTTATLHVGDGSTAGGTPLARLDSPAFTGNPTAPTQSAGNNTTRLATTAFVTAAVAAIPPATGMPAAVTGSLTTGTTAAFAVDFTTYSAYDILIEGLTNSIGGTLAVNVSSNGGTSFAAESRTNITYNGTTAGGNASNDLSLTLGSTSGLVGTLVQGATSGTALLTYIGGYPSQYTQTGLTKYATSAAINQVRLSLGSGSFSTGRIILQPKSLR